MKQKIIYAVLFFACMYLPAPSKECGKAVLVTDIKIEMQQKEKSAIASEDISSLPVSLFSGTLVNL